MNSTARNISLKHLDTGRIKNTKGELRKKIKGSGFRKGSKASDFSQISYKHVFLFLKEFVTFMCVLVLTFYFVKGIMSRIFILKPIGSANAVVVNNNKGGKEMTSTAAAVTISGTHS